MDRLNDVVCLHQAYWATCRSARCLSLEFGESFQSLSVLHHIVLRSSTQSYCLYMRIMQRIDRSRPEDILAVNASICDLFLHLFCRSLPEARMARDAGADALLVKRDMINEFLARYSASVDPLYRNSSSGLAELLAEVKYQTSGDDWYYNKFDRGPSVFKGAREISGECCAHNFPHPIVLINKWKWSGPVHLMSQELFLKTIILCDGLYILSRSRLEFLKHDIKLSLVATTLQANQLRTVGL